MSMNDAYYELLVAKKRPAFSFLVKPAVIAIIILLFLSTPIFGFPALLLAVILGAAAYFIIFPKIHIEYEYSLLNHDLEIDIIYNKSKRKKLLSLNLRQAEIIAPATSHRLDSYRKQKQLDYSAHDAAQTPYAIVIPVNQETTVILIQPNDILKERLKTALPRTFFSD